MNRILDRIGVRHLSKHLANRWIARVVDDDHSPTRGRRSACIEARHLRSEPARLRVVMPTVRHRVGSMAMMSSRNGLLIDLERALGGAGPRHATHLLERRIRAAMRPDSCPSACDAALRRAPLDHESGPTGRFVRAASAWPRIQSASPRSEAAGSSPRRAPSRSLHTSTTTPARRARGTPSSPPLPAHDRRSSEKAVTRDGKTDRMTSGATPPPRIVRFTRHPSSTSRMKASAR